MSAQRQDVVVGNMKEQIKSLLSAGILPSQVALAVGCEQSYISQLMTEDAFSQEVLTARILNLQAQSSRDAKYDHIEDRLLTKLEGSLEMMVNPDKILRALTVVNMAKRRGAAPGEQPMNQITNVIHLTLPTMVVNKYQTNQANEVIEVNGQGMVAMPAASLLEKVRDAEGAAVEQQQITQTINTDVQLPAAQQQNMEPYDHGKWQRKQEAQALLERIRGKTQSAGERLCQEF